MLRYLIPLCFAFRPTTAAVFELTEPRSFVTAHGHVRFEGIEIHENEYMCKIVFHLKNDSTIALLSGTAKLSFVVSNGTAVDHLYRFSDLLHGVEQVHRSPCMPGLNSLTAKDVKVDIVDVVYGETSDQIAARVEASRQKEAADAKKAALEAARRKQIRDARIAEAAAEERARAQKEAERERAEKARTDQIMEQIRLKCVQAKKSLGDKPIALLSTNESDLIAACRRVGYW